MTSSPPSYLLRKQRARWVLLGWLAKLTSFLNIILWDRGEIEVILTPEEREHLEQAHIHITKVHASLRGRKHV